MQARVSDAEESEPPRRARRRFSGILESGHGSLSSESDEIERTTPAQRSKPKSTADTRKDGRSTSQSARRESTANVRRQRKQKGVLIAVCGMTGTGKSTFVGKVAGQAVDVGHGLKSHTAEIQEVTCNIDGHLVTLVDTPGFDDTSRSDSDISRVIAEWMESTYEDDVLPSGIIYLHRITDNRVSGSSMKNIRMFRKLCGADSMSNILLVTTMWENVDLAEGNQRERELRSEGTFWSAMIAHGARVERYDNEQSTAFRLIRSLLGNTPIALNIQKQLVDDGKTLIDTDAGADVNAELIRMKKEHEEELGAIIEEMNEAVKSSNKALQRDLEANHTRVLAQMKLNEEQQRRLHRETKAQIERRLASQNAAASEQRRLYKKRTAELERHLAEQKADNSQTSNLLQAELNRLRNQAGSQQHYAGSVHDYMKLMEAKMSSQSESIESLERKLQESQRRPSLYYPATSHQGQQQPSLYYPATSYQGTALQYLPRGL